MKHELVIFESSMTLTDVIAAINEENLAHLVSQYVDRVNYRWYVVFNSNGPSQTEAIQQLRDRVGEE